MMVRAKTIGKSNICQKIVIDIWGIIGQTLNMTGHMNIALRESMYEKV